MSSFMWRIRYMILVLALVGIVMPSVLSQEEIIKTRSPQDVFDLFDRIGYTEEAWSNGVREVPKVFLTHIPKRWKENSGPGFRILPVPIRHQPAGFQIFRNALANMAA